MAGTAADRRWDGAALARIRPMGPVQELEPQVVPVADGDCGCHRQVEAARPESMHVGLDGSPIGLKAEGHEAGRRKPEEQHEGLGTRESRRQHVGVDALGDIVTRCRDKDC